MEMLVKMQSHLQLFRKVISEYFVWVSEKLFLASLELDVHSNVEQANFLFLLVLLSFNNN